MPRWRAAWPIAIVLGLSGGVAAQIADVREGTNIAVALAPNRTSLALDLMGGLWAMPAGGGGATALVPAGQGVRNPRFHPDGGSIVVQRWIDGQWDLWLYELGLGSWRALTQTSYDEREPDFSVDGRSVVFAANSTGHYCLWSLDLRDGALRQLTDEPGDSAFPNVSEGGEIVYAHRFADTDSLRLYAGHPTGTVIYRSDARLGAPSWRPGGRVVVFSEVDGTRESTLQMLVLADDEPVLKTLTNRAEDVFVSRAAWRSPGEIIYTADGQIWQRGIGAAARVAVPLFAGVGVDARSSPPVDQPLDAPGPHRVAGFVAGGVPRDDGRLAFAALGDLWLAERRDVEQLTDDAFLETFPSLSPDGASIVFVSDRGGNMDLWLLRLAGRVMTQLTGDSAKPFYPAFDATGRRIAFLETEGLGAWSAASLRVIDVTRPYEAQTLATELYDARSLRWEHVAGGAKLRLEARRSDPAGPLLAWTFTTGATEAGTSSGIPPTAPRDSALLTETLASLGLEWVPATPHEPYVVQVGRVFDGVRNEYLRHMDIHIEGQRITAIVRRGVLPLPERVVDAADATVIPGLIDVHAHHSALTGERLGRMWLANGVTTVREVGGDLAEAIERAEAWDSGRRLGPRLVISPLLQAPPDFAPPLVIRAYDDVSPGFAHAIELQRAELGLPPAGSRPPAHAASVGIAAARVLPLSARHMSYQDGLATVLASQTTVATGLAAASGWSAAAQRTQPRSVAEALNALFSPQERGGWSASPREDGGTVIGPLQDTIGRIVRSGGRVAIGTDAPAVPYGIGLHAELARLAEAGIPNDQVLRLASAGGAIALGLAQQLGTLETGKLADFVVLSGDPLTRIGDAATIVAVVKGGNWYARAALLERPTP